MVRLIPVALIAALAIAGCASKSPNLNGTGAGAGGYGAGYGDASNPTSPAYFQSQIGDRVLFAVDQSTLSDEGRQILNGQARWLNTNTRYSATVEGHADEQGTREYNLALGARRASAVYEYLVSQGVRASRLRTVSYGKERPIEVCSTEVCYAQNRRAVTVIELSPGV